MSGDTFTVEGIKRYKGSTYEVRLDDGRVLYLHADTITDFGICTGESLDRKRLREVVYASNFRRAYQRALYLLDYRDYSAAEMRKKLVSTYKNEALCDRVIGRLMEHGIIDDRRLASELARRQIAKRYGFRRAVTAITLKGIDRRTAEEALSEYEDSYAENLAYLIENKYADRLSDPGDRREIEKVKAALVRLGYSYDQINSALKSVEY